MKFKNICILMFLLSTIFVNAFAQSFEGEDFESGAEVEESAPVETDSSVGETFEEGALEEDGLE